MLFCQLSPHAKSLYLSSPAAVGLPTELPFARLLQGHSRGSSTLKVVGDTCSGRGLPPSWGDYGRSTVTTAKFSWKSPIFCISCSSEKAWITDPTLSCYSESVESNNYTRPLSNEISCDEFNITVEMHRNSLVRKNTAVVDFGHGERKSSADGHLIVQDILDAKLNIQKFSNVKKRLDETADVDIAEG